MKERLSFLSSISFAKHPAKEGWAMTQVTLTIPDNLYRYLSFLEKSRFISNIGEATITALEYYKTLAMHDWFPFVYRMGGSRVVLMDTTMILDFFHLLNNQEILNAAKTSAMKRKVTNPFFRDVDFARPENWPIALREMEIMGWGKFSHLKSDIRVESCILPPIYLQGYLEGMFSWSFKYQRDKTSNAMLFLGSRKSAKILERGRL
jgi:hypothetical protein